MAEENESPISAAKPPVVNPIKAVPTSHAATLKLKPVIRKPVVGAAGPAGVKLPSAKPAAAAAPAPAPAAPAAPAPGAPSAPVSTSESPAPGASMADVLKNITQRLKGVTQQIPQQAILHKTGIIADQDLTEAQKQASKSRTSRISLSDALGVAPVKESAAPMKTIRIKRPVDVKNPAAPAPAPAPAAAAPAPAPEPAPAAAPAPAPAAKVDTSVTQRKTLKISRPGAARPTKFGVKKPGIEPAAAPAADVADIPEVEDIPDMPTSPTVPFAPNAGTCPPGTIPDVSKVEQILGLVVQIAATVAIGFLAWQLYTVAQTPAYVGGLVF